MSQEIVIIIIGAAFLAAACTGGGLRIKEIEIPEIGAPMRLLTGVLGSLLLVVGLGLGDNIARAFQSLFTPEPTAYASTTIPDDIPTEEATDPNDPVPTLTLTPTPTPAPEPPVDPETDTAPGPDDPTSRRIEVVDHLADDQIYERIRVLINDQERFTFSIDKDKTSQSFHVTIKAGDRYSLIGSMAKREESLEESGRYVLVTYAIRGQGTFSAKAERTAYYIDIAQLDRADESSGNAIAQIKAQEP